MIGRGRPPAQGCQRPGPQARAEPARLRLNRPAQAGVV